MKKINDILIYRDENYFCAFPSIVRLPDGELLVAFRRAPERRPYGGRCTHADPNAQLVLVRSNDDGKTWMQTPDLIHAHAMGGSQDPCLTLLRDGTILCASYLWVLQQPRCPAGNEFDYTGWKHTFAGGYLVRSRDGGRHWEGPILPPPVPGSVALDAFNQPLPAYNRGNILAGSDNLLYWAVVRAEKRNTSVHLVVSADGGASWEYRCQIAEDENVGFNETYLFETAKGDLVAFLRTADGTGKVPSAIARSRNRGKTFEPWQNAGFTGHPHCAARLNDGRVLLAYGYRKEPYGIRARVLDPECTDFGKASEIILRDDGGSPDLGYPWPVVFPDGRVLVVYYFNRKDDIPGTWPESAAADKKGMTAQGGIRHIAGTWLEP